MFQAIISRAQRSVESAVTNIVMRAALAIPFLVALGFATAAAGVKLIEVYGHVEAFAILAAAFGVLGIVAAAVIAASSPKPMPGDETFHATEGTIPPPETEPNSLLNADMLVAALGVVGPKAIPAIPALMKFVVRNWALVLSLVIVSYLVLSEKPGGSRTVAGE